MDMRTTGRLALLAVAIWLAGCAPSVGGMGMGGTGMMGMPMGGFAYGGAWGHSTNVAVVNNHTTDVYASRRTSNTFVNDEHRDNFYHPGRIR